MTTRQDQTAHERIIPLLVQVCGARRYLELGVYQGECLIAVASANPDCECIGVDREPMNFGVPPNVKLIQSDVYMFFNSISPPTGDLFDAVFIDANHSEESVKEDFNRVWPYVSDNGLILLHDTFPDSKESTSPGLCGTAYLFAGKLGSKFGLEAVTLPYHPGLTIVRKRTKQVPWIV